MCIRDRVKDTSLANTIANKEIIMMAKEYSAKGLIWPLFSTALFFLAVSYTHLPLVSLVMNHRDHRKIVVVDGNVAYTGGVNLADE